jgi:cell division septation protein DedD
MQNNDLTAIDGGGDGFDGPRNTGRVRGTFLKWNDSTGWVTRDGLAPPQPLLVIAVKELLQRWLAGEPENIFDQPLPDPDELNAAIPKSEWETGIDGVPRPPWAHTVAVYLVCPATGQAFTYTSSTIGAHIAYDQLREAVITMRALRGARVMPLVLLGDRPMKTKFGMKLRPNFEIIGWRAPGEPQPIAGEMQPQLTAPTTAPATAAPSEPTETPASQAQAKSKKAQPKPKSTMKVAAETLSTMRSVEPVSLREEMDDDLDNW